MNSQNDNFDTKITPPSQFDDELFKQSLTEADDAAGFDQPWNPWTLVMLTFFFGITTGMALLAFNYQRLGIKGRLYNTIALGLVLEFLLTAIQVWAVQLGWLDPKIRADTRTFRLVTKVFSVLVAVIVTQTQMKRFRLFQRSGLPEGALLKPALAAIAVGVALDFIEAVIILPLFIER